MDQSINCPYDEEEFVSIAVTKLAPLVNTTTKYVIIVHQSLDFGQTWQLITHSVPSSLPQRIPHLVPFTEQFPPPQKQPQHQQQVIWSQDTDDLIRLPWSLQSMALLKFQVRAMGMPDNDYGQLVIPFAQLFHHSNINFDYPLVTQDNLPTNQNLTIRIVTSEGNDEGQSTDLGQFAASFKFKLEGVKKFGLLKGVPSTALQLIALDDAGKPTHIVHRTPVIQNNASPDYGSFTVPLQYLLGSNGDLGTTFQIRIVYFNDKTDTIQGTAGWCNTSLKEILKAPGQMWQFGMKHATKNKAIKTIGFLDTHTLHIRKIPLLSRDFFGNNDLRLNLSYLIDFGTVHNAVHCANVKDVIETFSEVFSPLTPPTHDFTAFQIGGMISGDHKGHNSEIPMVTQGIGYPERLNLINYPPFISPTTTPSPTSSYFPDYDLIKSQIHPDPDYQTNGSFHHCWANATRSVFGPTPTLQWSQTRLDGHKDIILASKPGYSILVYVTSSPPPNDPSIFTVLLSSVIVVGLNRDHDQAWSELLKKSRKFSAKSSAANNPIEYVPWNHFSTANPSQEVRIANRNSNRATFFPSFLSALYQRLVSLYIDPENIQSYDLHSTIQLNNNRLTQPDFVHNVDQKRTNFTPPSTTNLTERLVFTYHKVDIEFLPDPIDSDDDNDVPLDEFEAAARASEKELCGKIKPLKSDIDFFRQCEFYVEPILLTQTPIKTNPLEGGRGNDGGGNVGGHFDTTNPISTGYSNITKHHYFPTGSSFEHDWSPLSSTVVRFLLRAVPRGVTMDDYEKHIIVGSTSPAAFSVYIVVMFGPNNYCPLTLDPGMAKYNVGKVQLWVLGSVHEKQTRGKLIAFQPLVAAPQFQMAVEYVTANDRLIGTNYSHAFDIVRIGDGKIVHRSPRFPSGITTLPKVVLDLDQLLAPIDDFDTINPPINDDEFDDFVRYSVSTMMEEEGGKQNTISSTTEHGKVTTIDEDDDVFSTAVPITEQESRGSIRGRSGTVSNVNPTISRMSQVSIPPPPPMSDEDYDTDDLPPPPEDEEFEESSSKSETGSNNGKSEKERCPLLSKGPEYHNITKTAPAYDAPKPPMPSSNITGNSPGGIEPPPQISTPEQDLAIARQRLLQMEFEIRHIIYSNLERQFTQVIATAKITLKQLLQFTPKWQHARQKYDIENGTIVDGGQGQGNRPRVDPARDIQLAREKIGVGDFWIHPIPIPASPPRSSRHSTARQIGSGGDLDLNFSRVHTPPPVAKVTTIPIKLSFSSSRLFDRPSLARLIGGANAQILPTFSIDFSQSHSTTTQLIIDQCLSHCSRIFSPLSPVAQSFIVTGFGQYVPFRSHIEYRLLLASGFIPKWYHSTSNSLPLSQVSNTSTQSQSTTSYRYIRQRPAILSKGMTLDGELLRVHEDQRADWIAQRLASGQATDVNLAGAVAVSTGMASFYLSNDIPNNNNNGGGSGNGSASQDGIPPALDWGLLKQGRPLVLPRLMGHHVHICLVNSPYDPKSKHDFRQLIGEANSLSTSVVFVCLDPKYAEKWKKVGEKHFYTKTQSQPPIRTQIPHSVKIHTAVSWDPARPEECMEEIMKFVYPRVLEQLCPLPQ